MTEDGEVVDGEPEGDGVNISSPGWSAIPLCNDVLENIQLLTSDTMQSPAGQGGR